MTVLPLIESNANQNTYKNTNSNSAMICVRVVAL